MSATGWTACSLADIAVLYQGYGFPKTLQGRSTGDLGFYKVSDISRAVAAGNEYLGPAVHCISNEDARSLRATPLPKNSVVFARIGEAINLNRRALLPADALVDNNVIGAKARPGVDDRYLLHFLSTVRLGLLSQATTVPAVRTSDIAAIEAPVAPTNEQRRIVSKIDELFSRIDEGEQALKRVEKLVERYRQSVLKAAVTGELTRDWRAARKRAGEPVESGEALLGRILKARRAAWEVAELAKLKAKGKPPADDRWKQRYQEPAPPDATALPALPEGWVWASMDQLLVRIEAGKSFKCDERPPTKDEYGIVKVSAVTWGFYDESESKTITDSNRIEKNYLIRPGDFLFSRANTVELVGACATAGATTLRLLLSDKILRFVFAVDLKAWCDLVLKSRIGRDQIEELSTGNQESMRNIGQQRIARIAIPIPPPSEIAELICQRDRIQRAARELKNLAEAEQRRSHALRQSILKAAFSGQLVPQDPRDEPASKLLERIAAERATAPVAKRGRKARATKP